MTAGLHRDLRMLSGVLRHHRRWSLPMARRRLKQLKSSKLRLARPVEAFHGVVPQPIFLRKRAVQGGYVRRRDGLASRTELLPRPVDPSRARGAQDAGWRGHRTQRWLGSESTRDRERHGGLGRAGAARSATVRQLYATPPLVHGTRRGQYVDDNDLCLCPGRRWSSVLAESGQCGPRQCCCAPHTRHGTSVLGARSREQRRPADVRCPKPPSRRVVHAVTLSWSSNEHVVAFDIAPAAAS